MLHMTDKVFILEIGTQNFFSGTEAILQLPVELHGSRAKDDPQEHSAALASSGEVLLNHLPSGQQGQQALEPVSTQV